VARIFARARAPGALVAALATGGATLGCGGGAPRDVVPESKDVRGANGAPGGAAAGDGYEYVARRGLGAIAIAETRGFPKEIGASAAERLADALQSCAAEAQRQRQLARGAARVVAHVNDNGTVDAVHVKVSPGRRVAANAILCVVSPVKLLTFPPRAGRAEAGSAPAGGAGAGAPSEAPSALKDRGIAVEATWEGEDDAAP